MGVHEGGGLARGAEVELAIGTPSALVARLMVAGGLIVVGVVVVGGGLFGFIS